MSRILALITLLAIATPAYAQAPGAPGNLTNSVNGSTVTLTWSAAATGAVTGYLVEAAVVPGGAAVATLPVVGTTLTVPNVPTGAYFVRVRALNGAAQSAPSNETTVSVAGTGCPAPPTAPIVSISSTGLQATASWQSGSGCPSTSFLLQAGSGPGLANFAQVNVGSQQAVSAMVPPGTYYIRVIGSNQFGTSPPSGDLIMRVGPNALSETVRPSGVVSFDVVMEQTGTYTGTLVWDDPTIDLDLYLTLPGCPYPDRRLGPSNCLLSISDALGTVREAVSRPVVAGQAFRLYIDNFTDKTTAFTIQNAVAPGDTAAAVAAPDSSTETPTITKIKPFQ